MTTSVIPKNGFTTKYLDNLKFAPKRFEIADPGAKGLRLRVSPGGTKTFIWYYRDGAKIRRLTLGQYGDGDDTLTLAKARQKLITTKSRLNNGIKPHAESANAPRTVTDLCEFFYKRRIEGIRKRPDVVRQVLDHDIIPIIGTRRISSITPPTLARVVDKVVDRGAAVHANKVLATLKQIFNYAQARGFVDRSPAHPLKAQDLGIVNSVRERALDTDDEGEAQADLVEIRALWHALDKAPKLSLQCRLGTKILLLTGVRSGELRLAQWEHIDFNHATWKIPAGNTKNARGWTVPLSPQALDLFNTLQKSAKGSQWVLPSFTGEGPITDKALARAMKRLLSIKDTKGNSLLPIANFTPHDLRRTLRTHLSRLGVALHIAEKCLNHSLGRLEQTYDKHTYIYERREALDKWAKEVDLAVNSRETTPILGT